jgi:hypothetical protein
MRIEFLSMEGCPNTPVLRESLASALRHFARSHQVDTLDILSLAEQGDPRAGYGAPTILVDGVDLFGLPLPTSHEPACRLYNDGVPTAETVLTRLKSVAEM